MVQNCLLGKFGKNVMSNAHSTIRGKRHTGRYIIVLTDLITPIWILPWPPLGTADSIGPLPSCFCYIGECIYLIEHGDLKPTETDLQLYLSPTQNNRSRRTDGRRPHATDVVASRRSALPISSSPLLRPPTKRLNRFLGTAKPSG